MLKNAPHYYLQYCVIIRHEKKAVSYTKKIHTKV